MAIPYDRVENEAAWTAWQCVEQTSVNLFLTGNAGTGKTTFLKNLKIHSPKRMVVVAPTGVAAINAGGVTIHSFFQLPFAPFIPGTTPKPDHKIRREKINIMRTLDLLVIDEISMVRADLLDAIDATLRLYRRNERPFGGVQLLMIGDLQQLAPVVVESERGLISEHYPTPYFFSSQALQRTVYTTIELKRVYRQTDRIFIELLNKIRNNTADMSTLQEINARYIPDFDPADSEGYIRLTTHNNSADAINKSKLDAINATEQKYECKVNGTFPSYSYPADSELILKVGAQVMFLKNDSAAEKRYYNGKIGRVSALDDDKVTVACTDGTEVEIGYEEWQNTRYEINKETNEINEVVEGTFEQIPLRLAWAITIHKSQGLTFDKAIIDAQMSFAHGQVYVALSRCRTIQGLVLSRPLAASSIINDATVNGFIADQAQNAMTDEKMNRAKNEYFAALASELFSFRPITVPCFKLQQLLEEHCRTSYPKAVSEVADILQDIQKNILDVSMKFSSLCDEKKTQSDLRTDEAFKTRIVNGAKYFLEHLAIVDKILTASDLNIDNTTVSEQKDDLRSQIENEYAIKSCTLETIIKEGFSTAGYLRAKANAVLATERKDDDDEKPLKLPKRAVPADVTHKDLYLRLLAWRKREADNEDVREYMIMSQKAFVDIANYLPTNLKELGSMKGVGKAKLGAYGEKIIDMVKVYMLENNIMESPELPYLRPTKTSKEERRAKQKEEKKSTYEETLELFNKHLSIKEIAEIRNLKVSTICGHLVDMAQAGKVELQDVMGRERYNKLTKLIESNPSLTVGEMCVRFQSDGYYYKEISALVKLLHPEKVNVKE